MAAALSSPRRAGPRFARIALRLEPAQLHALARGAAGRLIRGLTDKIPGASSLPEKAAPGEAGKERAAEEPARDVEGLLRKLLPGR